MQRAKACVFCGEGTDEPLTAEHLWSAWMSGSFIKARPPLPKKNQRKNPFVIVERLTKNQPNRVRPANEINIKPRCLCHTCNHETLGNFEEKYFKPLVEPMMLHGTPRTLTLEDQLVIAVWAFKTLIVQNHGHNDPPFFYSTAERKRFITELIPPERNFRVWLARFKVKGHEGHLTGLPLIPNRYASGERKYIGCYSLTFSSGQFMFQAHAAKWIGLGRGPSDLTQFLPEPPGWEGRTVQVWPVTGDDIQWPPPFHIGSSTLDDFTYRWGPTPRPM